MKVGILRDSLGRLEEMQLLNSTWFVGHQKAEAASGLEYVLGEADL